MAPSKSSLGLLPKVLAERWEHDREAFEPALRHGLQIPEGAVSIAVSLEGVLAPIDGANNPTDVRTKAAAEGRASKEPAGYREASRATVAFCDAKGRDPDGARTGDEEGAHRRHLRSRGHRLADVIAFEPLPAPNKPRANASR